MSAEPSGPPDIAIPDIKAPAEESMAAAAAANVHESIELAQEEQDEHTLIALLDELVQEGAGAEEKRAEWLKRYQPVLNNLVREVGGEQSSAGISLTLNAKKFEIEFWGAKERDLQRKLVSNFKQFADDLIGANIAAKARAEEPVHPEGREVTAEAPVDARPSGPVAVKASLRKGPPPERRKKFKPGGSGKPPLAAEKVGRDAWEKLGHKRDRQHSGKKSTAAVGLVFPGADEAREEKGEEFASEAPEGSTAVGGQQVDRHYLVRTETDLSTMIKRLRDGGRGVGAKKWATFGTRSKRGSQIEKAAEVEQAKEFVEELTNLFRELRKGANKPLDPQLEQDWTKLYDRAEHWLDDIQSGRKKTERIREGIAPGAWTPRSSVSAEELLKDAPIIEASRLETDWTLDEGKGGDFPEIAGYMLMSKATNKALKDYWTSELSGMFGKVPNWNRVQNPRLLSRIIKHATSANYVHAYPDYDMRPDLMKYLKYAQVPRTAKPTRGKKKFQKMEPQNQELLRKFFHEQHGFGNKKFTARSHAKLGKGTRGKYTTDHYIKQYAQAFLEASDTEDHASNIQELFRKDGWTSHWQEVAGYHEGDRTRPKSIHYMLAGIGDEPAKPKSRERSGSPEVYDLTGGDSGGSSPFVDLFEGSDVEAEAVSLPPDSKKGKPEKRGHPRATVDKPMHEFVSEGRIVTAPLELWTETLQHHMESDSKKESTGERGMARDYVTRTYNQQMLNRLKRMFGKSVPDALAPLVNKIVSDPNWRGDRGLKTYLRSIASVENALRSPQFLQAVESGTKHAFTSETAKEKFTKKVSMWLAGVHYLRETVSETLQMSLRPLARIPGKAKAQQPAAERRKPKVEKGRPYEEEPDYIAMQRTDAEYKAAAKDFSRMRSALRKQGTDASAQQKAKLSELERKVTASDHAHRRAREIWERGGPPSDDEKEEPRIGIGEGGRGRMRGGRARGRGGRGGRGFGFGPQRGHVRGAVQRYQPPELRAAARNEVYARNNVPVQRSTQYIQMASGDVEAPSAGRVHYVAMGPLGKESTHFLKEMDADSNMGATRLLNSSRRGPFREERGSSRVLSRTRHITYRRRGHTMEITISRGATPEEMDELVGKLAVHRMSTTKTVVWFVDSKKKKMGQLDRIDLIKLRDKIMETLSSRNAVGLRLVDAPGHHGAMFQESNHSYDMTEFSKRI